MIDGSEAGRTLWELMSTKVGNVISTLGFSTAEGGSRPQDGSFPERIPLQEVLTFLLLLLIVRNSEPLQGKSEALCGKEEPLSGKNVALMTGKMNRGYSCRSDSSV
jgi:hypothetical protein